MNILCIIANIPEKRWCVFLNSFKNYKVYIIVNDNEYDLTEYIRIYKNIQFIKIDESKCISNGYTNCEFSDKLINGWDKALYYFGVENKNYEFIWFMEDDVFFYKEETLGKIDINYKTDDLLSNSYYSKTDNRRKNLWNWDNINIAYNEPYYSGTMNSVRVSKKMMNSINNYAIKNKKIFYIEALFPTIAKKNNLIYSNPTELFNIQNSPNYERKDVNKTNIYHPEKDLNIHLYYRYHLIPHLIIQ
jgi:hypothetical protein